MNLTQGHSLHIRAAYRRAFNHVLTRPCRRHDAKAGQACWTMPDDVATPAKGQHVAVCGARIAAAYPPARADRTSDDPGQLPAAVALPQRRGRRP